MGVADVLVILMVTTFLFSVLLFNQLGNFFTRKQRRVEERLKSTVVHTDDSRSLPQRLRKKSNHRSLKVRLPGMVIGKKYRSKLQADLVKAGLPLKAEEMVSLTLISAVASCLLVSILWNNVFAGIGIGLLILVGSGSWIVSLKKRRVLRIEDQLLDSVVLLASSLRAGHSFLQALELVGRETRPPLSVEFDRLIKEIRLAIPLEEALVNLSQRVESKDLEMVVTGVLIQRQVGGNLAEVLDEIAYTIERRIKMRAKVRALTAQGRLSAWIVSLLPFALAAFIFGKNPQFANIMLQEPLGRLMLILGGVFLLGGILVIRKVVNVDV
jgi:tight adherence protein B